MGLNVFKGSDKGFIFLKIWAFEVISAAIQSRTEPGYFYCTFISIMGCYGDSLQYWLHIHMN